MDISGKHFFIPDWLLQENSQTMYAYIHIVNAIHTNEGEFVTTKKELTIKFNMTTSQLRTFLSKMEANCQFKIKNISNRNTVISLEFKAIIEHSVPNIKKTAATKTETKKAFSFKRSLLEYGFKEHIVDDWIKVRRTRKATNTESAFKAFITEMEKKQCDINEMLLVSVTNSWSGFKHIWVENLNKEKNQQTQAIKEEKIGRTSLETIKKNSEYNGQY